MDITAFREEIKLKMTGGLLELEISDNDLDKLINSALREIQRYICSTKIITVPFSKCIDMSTVTDENGDNVKVNSIARIYRPDGYATTSATGVTTMDPMYASQWQMLSGAGNLANFQDYIYNYASWNTLLQIRNTTSTDLAFRYDKASNKLYINVSTNNPQRITIEYIPRYDNVDEIVSDYWIDMLSRMTLALTKITVGRVRSRYTQTNALWQQDANILQEGLSEYKELQNYLQQNTQLLYAID